ncbi:metalloprotease 1 [Coprinopsis cinerea okayama7|uniref:Metalloprotease 1 n=1 Tax=Coprinopsis cinerea (strain Okayama-7 / 130 / ATCC MYA-4618 / FGSC 9003) TaxID=240176 RepID=A8NKS0_COPC7|nr:metalloprotease 1 [Coprinopsis cinerea okayama7\|eukprot:XP_001834531.2 metalloprotease 1 [Coprinopsis cinerea okayama7\
MFLKSYLVFAVTLSTSANIFTNALSVRQLGPIGRLCGNELDEATKAILEADFQLNQVPPPAGISTTSTAANLASPVNVFFHVVSKDETPEGGNVPDSAIDEQMDVLNTAFGETGLQFRLAEVTRSVNESWFGNADKRGPRNFEMKAALRRGGRADLNVWTTGLAWQGPGSSSLLGYATFPVNVTVEPENDGVVVLYSTLPKGDNPPFNLGHTLTHEVGHWVGLYHTFEGFSCRGTGDEVDDTPPQRNPTTGCPADDPTRPPKNSCPAPSPDEEDLPDPIHNYMDYSDDRCMNEFTPGQIERMHAHLATYRGIELRTGGAPVATIVKRVPAL